jgi:alpha-L-rhamnosidase
LAKTAALLGETEDSKYYQDLRDKVSDAYVSLLTDGNGKLNKEFQTAYALPLYFGLFPKEQRVKAAENLVKLVEKNDYCIGTGFPGTPYILFALADNGRADVAYKMLMNTKCPSWLYEVKAGATTIWERWDALDENGACMAGEDGTGGMVSFNHYAFGAVGDFFYRRIVGIEASEGGYKSFSIRPLLGGGLTYAKGSVLTPYGKIASEWKLDGGRVEMNVEIPMGTTCKLVMPSGEEHTLSSGKYSFQEPVAL